ncbi:hypothetical protein OG379_07895 [Streptomyces sp. NBC_01166]|uniref:hypothetical protein n=1 Tax=Streptomyces sp. NBC_01166 TaxID=2903755 RepID=UPI003865C5A6|nr:hypothetical protein OG379_07895 [Streptomyces sp. NBC_01166]
MNLVVVKLNARAFDHAKKLVKERQVVLDDRDEWSEHRPSAEEENCYLEQHGFSEFRKWYLGEDDEQNDENKGRYKFPYGDFEKVHRGGVLSAESRAGQYKHTDIEVAVAHVHGMLEELS